MHPRTHGRPGERWRVTSQYTEKTSRTAEWLLLDGELLEQARELGYEEGQPVAMVAGEHGEIKEDRLYALTTLDDPMFDPDSESGKLSSWEQVYPEHEKLAAIKERSQAIGEFLDFGPGVLCEWVKFDEFEEEQLVPMRRPIQSVLAKYFGIDEQKLNDEKEQMLDKLRELNAR